MTTEEFSARFDVLYNNINSEQAPGLNEYEKSVFLTKAQEEFVLSLYNGRNATGLSFEVTEEVRRYLGSLIKSKRIKRGYPTDVKSVEGDSDIFKISKKDDDMDGLFVLPHDLYFIITEQVEYGGEDKCIGGTLANVYPITADEYSKIKNNPFRGITKYKAVRLDVGQVTLTYENESTEETDDTKTNNEVVEVISSYPVSAYIIRYLASPKPIILEDIDNGSIDYAGMDLEIKGENKKSECELPESTHEAILQAAVNLAKVAWTTTVH